MTIHTTTSVPSHDQIRDEDPASVSQAKGAEVRAQRSPNPEGQLYQTPEQNKQVPRHANNQDSFGTSNGCSGEPVTPLKESNEQKKPGNGAGCNCKKSKCLKLYCECFANQGFCSEGCNCIDCKNKPEHLQEKQKAIQEALARNPEAFTKIELRTNLETKKGCSCKKTHCKKKYCECYGSGNFCQQFCKCEGCQNLPNYKGGDESTSEKESPLIRHTEAETQNPQVQQLDLQQRSEDAEPSAMEQEAYPSNNFSIEQNQQIQENQITLIKFKLNGKQLQRCAAQVQDSDLNGDLKKQEQTLA